jgi:hypothetical protein
VKLSQVATPGRNQQPLRLQTEIHSARPVLAATSHHAEGIRMNRLEQNLVVPRLTVVTERRCWP